MLVCFWHHNKVKGKKKRTRHRLVLFPFPNLILSAKTPFPSSSDMQRSLEKISISGKKVESCNSKSYSPVLSCPLLQQDYGFWSRPDYRQIDKTLKSRSREPACSAGLIWGTLVLRVLVLLDTGMKHVNTKFTHYDHTLIIKAVTCKPQNVPECSRETRTEAYAVRAVN